MTDNEKIEQAANSFMVLGNSYTYAGIFKEGVEWRDLNPSPKVMALFGLIEEWFELEAETLKTDGEFVEEAVNELYREIVKALVKFRGGEK